MTNSACTAAEPLSPSPAGRLAACSPRVVAEVIDRVPAPPSWSQAADKPSLAIVGHLANSAGIVGHLRSVSVTATCGETSPAVKHLFSGGMTLPSRPALKGPAVTVPPASFDEPAAPKPSSDIRSDTSEGGAALRELTSTAGEAKVPLDQVAATRVAPAIDAASIYEALAKIRLLRCEIAAEIAMSRTCAI